MSDEIALLLTYVRHRQFTWVHNVRTKNEIAICVSNILVLVGTFNRGTSWLYMWCTNKQWLCAWDHNVSTSNEYVLLFYMIVHEITMCLRLPAMSVCFVHAITMCLLAMSMCWCSIWLCMRWQCVCAYQQWVYVLHEITMCLLAMSIYALLFLSWFSAMYPGTS